MIHLRAPSESGSRLLRARRYWHMTGNGYKGGSYKGLDISFGGPLFYGGVLIRAVENLRTGEAVVGPCRVADHVLALLKSPSIAAFVERNGVRYDTGELVLERRPGLLARREVHSSARVGLSLKAKKPTDATQPLRYWGRSLRFMTNPERLKNHPVLLALALFARGYDAPRAAAVVGCKTSAAANWLEGYRRGIGRDTASFFGRVLSTQDKCQLYGALYGSQ